MTRHGQIEFLCQFLTYFFKVIRNGPQLFRIDIRIVNTVLQSHDHRFRCRLTGNGTKRRQSRINNIDARFSSLQIGHFSESACTMRMQFNGNMQVFFQHAHKIVCIIRSQKSRHIFNTKRVDTHLLQFHGTLGKAFQGMNRTDCINHRTLDMNGLRILTGFNSRFKITRIVKGVEDANNINAVIHGPVDKFIHHIVRIMSVT